MSDDQITTKPMASQAQWRYLFASGKPFARRWAEATPGGKGTRFRRLPIKKKAYSVEEFAEIALKEASDPVALAIAAAHTPDLASLKGQQLAPGVTRIHGDLCNVHGRWGSCRAAGYGGAGSTSKRVAPKKLPTAPKPKAGGRAKKGRAARAAAKPKLTPEQRAQARQAQHDQNTAKVLHDLAIPEDAAGALADLRAGKPVEDDGGLIKMGLAEQGADGGYRLTATGRAFVSAAEAGDAGRARDALGRAHDQQAGREERATASADRKRAAEERQAAVAAKRAEAARLRAERLAKQKRGGGSKKQQPVPKAPARAPTSRSSSTPRPVFGGGGKGSRQPQPKKPTPQLPQAVTDAAQALSDGKPIDDTIAALLIRNGLAKRNKDGMLVLTAAGQRATKKEATLKAPTPGDYLIVEDPAKPTTWHLQVKRNGRVDHGLLGAAWAALHGGFRGNKYEGPNKGEALTKLKRLYASEGMDVPSEKASHRDDAKPGQREKNQHGQQHPASKDSPTGPQEVMHKTFHGASIPPSFAVFKDATGAYRWIARTTTAYRDRDGEIISEKALEDDAARMTTTGVYGPLRYWHVGRPDPLSVDAPWGPGLDIGTCDYSTVIGRTSIESGTFKSEAIGRAFSESFSDYELSPGFFHAPTEPDAATGVFNHIRRFERSVVPTQHGRASNLFTGLTVKEHQMDQATYDKRVKAYLDFAREKGIPPEDAAAPIVAMERADKEAGERQIAYKEERPKVIDLFRAFFTGEQVATKGIEPEPAVRVADLHAGAVIHEEPGPALVEPSDDLIAALKSELDALRAEIASLKATPMMDPEDDPAQGGDAGADEAAEGESPMDGGGLTLSSEDLAAIGQMFGGVLQAELGPLVSALGITQKLDGHMTELKGLLGGYVKQKEAGDTQRTDTITALKATIDQQQAAIAESQAKLGELLGDQPRSAGYRPSQASDNGAEQLLAAIKDGPDGPSSDGPFDDLIANLFPGLAQGGTT